MNVVIIGTGNVGTVLSRLIRRSGHTILQICGRNFEMASALANESGAVPVTDLKLVNPQADIYIIAVSDQAVASVSSSLKPLNGLLVHTAGSVPINILKDRSDNYGILYPLQSLRKEIDRIPAIPFLIEANSKSSTELLQAFATTLSDRVSIVSEKERTQLHLGAVVINNFVNHLYTIARSHCEKVGISFELLLPLISETAQRVEQFSPDQLQTGPAIRNDKSTIEKHLSLLESDPRLRDMYNFFTDSISRYYAKG